MAVTASSGNCGIKRATATPGTLEATLGMVGAVSSQNASAQRDLRSQVLWFINPLELWRLMGLLVQTRQKQRIWGEGMGLEC
jgi:hypothetical protein